MKKINKHDFLNKFIPQYHDLFEVTDPSAFVAMETREINIKNKFYYSSNNPSILRNIHNNIHEKFLSDIPINNAAIGFKKNFSYLHLFEPHRKNYHFLRIDIKSFFPSISTELIKDCFQFYFDDVYLETNKNNKLIDAFISLVTYKVPDESENIEFRSEKILPIGFSTSPIISNIVFRKIDLILQKICLEKNIVYTRYADDMLFSSSKEAGYLHSISFENEIRTILYKYNFIINDKKTIKISHTLSLNGYIIENTTNKNEAFIRISNKKTKIISKLLYELEKKKPSKDIILSIFSEKEFTPFFPCKKPEKLVNKYYMDQVLNKLKGYRSYLISIIKFHNQYQCSNHDSITKYSSLIDGLNKQIDLYSKSP